MEKSLLILTGHSKGLGRAILEVYLQKEEFEIIGISRTTIGLNNPKLTEISLDFGDLDVLENEFTGLFPSKEYTEVILINNAGWIGEVKAIGSLQVKMMREAININLLAPMYLTNAFVAAYKETTAQKIICNIGSGAGFKPLEGWGKYCASKAALAMFTLVGDRENSNSRFRFFSVAPGIVDTHMQEEIRQADESDFPQSERFKSYKENGDLATPESVAMKISYLLGHESEFPDVIQDVRNFDLP